MAKLPRQSRRLQVKLLEYSPTHLEGLRALVSPSDSRVGSPEARESSLIVRPDYQIQTIESIQEPISFSEVTSSIPPSSELVEEPEISEPDIEPTVTPTSGFSSSTSSNLGSPRVSNIITQNFPSGLISIEELVSPDEDVTLPEYQHTLNLRERESILYSPFRSGAWYLSLTNFLENPGLSFSPSQIPFHPTPKVYFPSPIMSRQSSMFSQLPEIFYPTVLLFLRGTSHCSVCF